MPRKNSAPIRFRGTARKFCDLCGRKFLPKQLVDIWTSDRHTTPRQACAPCRNNSRY